MGEEFKFLREQKQEHRHKMFCENISIIADSKLRYIQKDLALLFRNGLIKTEFYPSTGRWVYKGKTYNGGAKSFLNWYIKKKEEVSNVNNS